MVDMSMLVNSDVDLTSQVSRLGGDRTVCEV